MTTIEEELALVYKCVPDFAPRVVRAIEEGTLDTRAWCGCFYGISCHGEGEIAIRLEARIARKLKYLHGSTPIQILLRGASGRTHQTHAGLKTLYEALTPYLPSSPSEEA